MVFVVCYMDVYEYETRQEAIRHFKECYYMSEGAEQERYANILIMLQDENCYLAYDDESEFEAWKKTDKSKTILMRHEIQELSRADKEEREQKKIEQVASKIYEILADNNEKLRDNTYISLTDYNDIFFDADGVEYEIKIIKK